MDVMKKRQAYRGPALSIRFSRRAARMFETSYFLRNVEGKKARVCKHAFKSILGVQDSRVRSIALKLKDNKSADITKDGRGEILYTI